jgi:hypothetical protein
MVRDAEFFFLPWLAEAKAVPYGFATLFRKKCQGQKDRKAGQN